MRVFGFCFARGGSKGIVNKNLKKINGRSLVELAISSSKRVELIDKFFVSTDSEEIGEEALRWEAGVIKRPPNLASDRANELDAWKHAVKWVQQEYRIEDFIFVSVPATSPLRLPSDITKAISVLLADYSLDGVMGVTESARSPYFNMVTKDSEGCLNLASKLDGRGVSRRQDAPALFDITTVVYAYRSSYILEGGSVMGGRISSIEIPRSRSIDIDEPIDLEIARFLYESLRIDEKV